jgi:hypothetical protein
LMHDASTFSFFVAPYVDSLSVQVGLRVM